MSIRRPPFLIPVLLIVVLAAAFLIARPGSEDEPERLAAGDCPQGFTRLSDQYVRELREGAVAGGAGEESEAEREAEEREGNERSSKRGYCLRDGVRRPEPLADLAKVNTTSAQRLGLDSPTALATALQQKERLANDNTTVPGTAGSWTPFGKGPVIFDDPDHPDNFGLRRGAGRITDFAYDPQGKRLFSAVASGGVWMTTDLGKSWSSIGDNLPIQTVGAVAWTPAGGGTLIALTGDNAFGGNTYGGTGVFYSTNLGRSWTKAEGAPDGAMGFRLAVRPDQPQTVYAATGVGLYRSTDAGRTWADVKLPVGECAGQVMTKKGCFLSSVVTDVVAQGPDKFGNKGGPVLATVGWRAGRRKSPDGTVQAPANGVYTSDSGAPGSFKQVGDDAGFLESARVGRVSLGIADGPEQNQDYVYALVQDSELFNTGKVEGLDVPGGDPTGLTATPTYIDGAYVTGDFGASWTKIVDRSQFLNPANGSTLAQLSALGFGPGIQSWYNSWIQPDPGAQQGGVPTRLSLGLEEIFETRTPGAPQNTPTDITAVGPYSAFGGACVITLTGKICGQSSQTSGRTTTHPDQHGAVYVPGPDGKEVIVVGNDGGAYVQAVPGAGQNMTPEGFGGGNNEGFNTLLPYGVAVAKDNIAYAGLQDNGSIRVDKEGRQVEVYGGDGTFTLTDPDNSDLAVVATPGGFLSRTKDGGKNFDDVYPSGLTDDAQFLTPFVMDPTNKKHLAVGGRKIFETDKGIDGLGEGVEGDGSYGWTEVYDLGTASKPGDKEAEPTETDPANLANAIATLGKTTYVGYCGTCDPVRDNQSFKGGIATNVGGAWHIAKATGLPQRIINHVAIDPDDPRTVYAALGESTARPYAPAKALGEDGTDPSGGFVYKSTDGGETFTDITGDLPRIGATWLLVRGKQLIAGTTVGVFASRTRAGKEWGLLGDDLPAAPVFSMQIHPGDPDRLIVATLGRGLYSYRFANPTTSPGSPNCRDTIAPVSRFTTKARTASARRKLVLRGRASDKGCRKGGKGRVARVTVSIAKAVGRKCRYMKADGRLAREKRSCKRTKYVRAKGTTRWTLRAKRRLPAGRYKLWVRAIDRKGNVERKRFGRNGRRIRLR